MKGVTIKAFLGLLWAIGLALIPGVNGVPRPSLHDLTTKNRKKDRTMSDRFTKLSGGAFIHRPPSIGLPSVIQTLPSILSSAFDQSSMETVVDASEILSMMTSMLIMGLFYNSVGTIASEWRNADFTSFIATRFDYKIPVVPVMIIPYVLVYSLPFLYTASCLLTHGVHRSLAKLRRFYLTQHILMASAYALYIFFPVSISSFAVPHQKAGILQEYTYNFVNRGMTTFFACPSMHVAHTLSMALIQRSDGLPGGKLAMIGAVATFFSTVLTRAHFILDVPFGIAFAVLINRTVHRRLEGKLEPLQKGEASRESLGRRFLTLLGTPLALGALFLRVETLTGSKTDMVGMLKGNVRI